MDIPDGLSDKIKPPVPNFSDALVSLLSTGVVVDGHTTHVNGIFIDITKQKQAEDALREKTRDLKRLNEHIHSLIYQLSPPVKFKK